MRRAAAAAWACFVLVCFFGAPRAAAQDGIRHQDWFHASFGVLAEDLAHASAAGKRLAVVWEQKGCKYCIEMHAVHFSNARIAAYVRDNFLVVQLDFRGDRPVVDFDGEAMTEKALARKYAITTTPTIQFFPEMPPAPKGKKGAEIEVARMPGLVAPEPFLGIFEYVKGRHYERQDLPTFLRARQGR